ncbi:MAG: apolipoprotein N-acyltransferase, partial [Pseudomonadota bacterium]
HHLVPFGEYLPMKGLLRAIGLAQLAPFEDGFTPGEGPRTLTVAGSAFAPLICYEAIFPGALYPHTDRPAWLAAVTNDAWFGDSSGPRQHLDQARLRVIESGLPMARAANTGVSALIDARGVYVDRTPLYTAGVINAPLPTPLPPTMYARFGDLIFALMMIIVAVFAQIWRKYAEILNDPT